MDQLRPLRGFCDFPQCFRVPGRGVGVRTAGVGVRAARVGVRADRVGVAASGVAVDVTEVGVPARGLASLQAELAWPEAGRARQRLLLGPRFALNKTNR